MPYDLDLKHWLQDGSGTVASLGGGTWEVSVQTPLTLWCPTAAAGNIEITFESQVLVENSAMLLLACARNWRGGRLLEARRSGDYADYAYRDMDCYTLGFNRAAHVRGDVQPNASLANVRRIGGAEGASFADVDLRDRSPAMMARWEAWNNATLLCSAYEPGSGTGCYYRYRAVFETPRISLHLGDDLLLATVDHHPEPLHGGAFGIRNMTPGGKFRLRGLAVRDL